MCLAAAFVVVVLVTVVGWPLPVLVEVVEILLVQPEGQEVTNKSNSI